MRRLGLLGLVALGLAGAAFLALRRGPDDAPPPDRMGERASPEAPPDLVGVPGTVSRAERAEEARTFTVRGRIVTQDGEAAPGVRVTARAVEKSVDAFVPWNAGGSLEPARSAPPVIAESTSAADGSFELACRSTGGVAVRAEPEPPKVGTFAYVRPEGREGHELRLRVLDGSPIAGRVVDAADRGVEAVIWAGGVRSPPSVWLEGPVATALPSGDFGFAGLPEGEGVLLAVVPRRLAIEVPVTMPVAGPLVIRLGADDAVVHGRVADVAGAPVAGATVTVRAGDPVAGSTGVATSGADGRWRVHGLPPGPIQAVDAEAPGFLGRRVEEGQVPWSGAVLPDHGEVEVPIVLLRGGAIEGSTREAGSGRLLAGVEVTAVPTERGDRRRATSGPDGRYRVEALEPGRVVLAARSATHHAAVLLDVPEKPPPEWSAITEEGTTVVRDLHLAPGLALRVRVVDTAGRALPDVEVDAHEEGISEALRAWPRHRLADGGGEGSTGPDGTCELTALPPGDRWVVRASLDGWADARSEPVPLRAEAPVPEVRLTLARGASVTGRVLDPSGRPVEGAWVGAGPEGGVTDRDRTTEDGTFRVDSLGPGPFELTVEAEGYVTPEVVRGWDPLAEGEERVLPDIRLEVAARVRGVLVDADGAPIPGASVRLESEETGESDFATTSEDGQFDFTDPPVGRVRFEMENPEGRRPHYVRLGEPFDSPAEGLRFVGTRIPRAVIEGRVLDPDGKPVPHFRVWAAPVARFPLADILAAVSDPDVSRQATWLLETEGRDGEGGRFRFVVRGEAPFHLAVASPRDHAGRPSNLMPAVQRIEDATRPVEIRLAAGHELAGRVVDETGRGVSGVDIATEVSSLKTGDDGSFRIVGLTQKRARLRVSPPPAFVVPLPVDAVVGGDVRIVLRTGTRISGRVLGPDGEPVASGAVVAEWAATPTSPETSRRSPIRNGRFEVEGIPAEAVVMVTVSAEAPEEGAEPEELVVEGVRPGTTDLVLRLPAGD